MEKLVYTIFGSDLDGERGLQLRHALAALEGPHRLQLNLPERAFTGGQEPIRNLLPAFDGAVFVWVDSRRDRAPLEALLQELDIGFHGYAVCESVPMPARLPEPDGDGAVDALSQLVLLRKPREADYARWLSAWIDAHTPVAIACQGTVAYEQNIVQAALTDNAPPLHGIVEECFPAAAYGDLDLFFAGGGDRERLQGNIRRLLESSGRVAAPDALDRIFTARHIPAAAQSAGAAGAAVTP